MRIALVNNFFVPRPSGSAHLTEGLARTLTSAGHEVLVVTAAFGDAPASEERDGYRIVRLPCWSPPKTKLAFNYELAITVSPRNLRRVFRLLDEFRPDVVHQHGQFFDLTWMSAIWARRRNVPTVLTVHTALTHTVAPFRAVLWCADQILVRPFLAIGRPHVVVIDRFISNYVHSRYHLPGERVVGIPIGVDPDRFRTVDPAPVREQYLLGSRPVILSVGHVIPLRDRLALVRALPYIIDKHPEVAVLVVGRVFDDRFLHLADDLGVRDALIVTGQVAKDDLPAFVAAADVEGHDFQGYGLGTASLEVMAAGVPVVSVVRPDNFPFPGMRLESWKNVVIVPPDDPMSLAEAVLRLIEDAALARRVGRGQQQFVQEHFSIAAVTASYEALYERAISAARPSRGIALADAPHRSIIGRPK